MVSVNLTNYLNSTPNFNANVKLSGKRKKALLVKTLGRETTPITIDMSLWLLKTKLVN
jgi:hypothetical protein